MRSAQDETYCCYHYYHYHYHYYNDGIRIRNADGEPFSHPT